MVRSCRTSPWFRWCWAAGRSWLSCRVQGAARPGRPPASLAGLEGGIVSSGIEDAAARASDAIVGSVNRRPSPPSQPARRRSAPPPAAGGAATTTVALAGQSPSLPEQLLVQLLQAGPLLAGPRPLAAGVLQAGGRELAPVT
jgi:hypothetical protein